jgi:GrpB-like predicted nucleotidyltransferase (UPF0157 family)
MVGVASDEPPPFTPLTDEQIRAATVGKPTPLAGLVELVDYDPWWPDLFEREAARIRSILVQRVRLLEHAGSTAVPGLAAKPIIDMVLAVADSADEPAYVPDMEAAGYPLRIRESDWFQHRLFKGPDTNINLHVFSDGCPEIERMLAFRDRLRTHVEDQREYERIKRELSARTWRYVQNYADAKSEVVRAILARTSAPP